VSATCEDLEGAVFTDDIIRAGHFRYKYRYFDIRYLSDTEKSIEISDYQSIGISYIVLQNFTSDTPILYRIRKKVSDQNSIKNKISVAAVKISVAGSVGRSGPF
jgi:hypothetical protein